MRLCKYDAGGDRKQGINKCWPNLIMQISNAYI